MKKVKLILMACLLTMGLYVQAENKQTVTVGERTLEQNVVKITFDGDNVNMNLSDGTSMTADMNEVSIAFDWVTSMIIEKYEDHALTADDNVYDLQGRRVINVQMHSGIYLVRQNGKTVKIIKK